MMPWAACPTRIAQVPSHPQVLESQVASRRTASPQSVRYGRALELTKRSLFRTRDDEKQVNSQSWPIGQIQRGGGNAAILQM